MKGEITVESLGQQTGLASLEVYDPHPQKAVEIGDHLEYLESECIS